MAGALLAVALVSACDATPSADDAASPSSAPTSAAPATSDAPAPDGTSSPAPEAPTAKPVAVRAGDVTLTLTAPDATADPGRDGTATVTVDPGTATGTGSGTGPAGAAAALSAAPGATFTVHTDGSATVEQDGVAVGGLTSPTGAARFRLVDPGVLAIDGDAPTSTTLGTTGVQDAAWGDREGGDSLAVTPTDWARRAGQAGVDVVWAGLVADDPALDTPTMHDQLVCHALGAPDKATWNLEPWRPDVGLLQVLAARCNPTA
ncbi:uncharacterized protein DUF2599 [Isoptericola jiangsuensis]|uniref:Uncharacterized protein DUF2599 n=1 Tax=Isoptericola jiangsuensis TaxID=548579 RepID=A0A2A9EYR2_9MICO|nr:uncharacterized protein DUF2599 [Isoptericola jiangsuensis]